MDFTIRLRAEGTAETRAQADAVKAVRTELETTQKKPVVKPKIVVEKPQKTEPQKLELIKPKTDPAALRELAREAESARKELARLSAESRNIKAAGFDSGSRIAKDVDRRTTIAKGKVAETTSAFFSAGGGGFDPKAYDAEQKANAAREKAQAKGTGNAKQSLSSLIAIKTVLAQQGAEALKWAVGLGRAGFGLAMGVAGMARLSMISQQASFNMRRLFTGTNPRPLFDVLQRTGQLIDPRTFTGKTLGDFLVRSSNAFFNVLAKAEPYARMFFKGMLLGVLQAEGAWLKLRVAIQPALNMLPNGIGLMTAFAAGALTVKAAFSLMGVGLALGVVKAAGALLSFGVSAATATAPLLPYALAIGGVVAAVTQLKELLDAWDENSFTQITTQLKSDLGISTKEETEAAMSKRQGITTGDDYDRKYKLGKYAEKPPATATPMPKGAEKQAAGAGPPIGKNLGLGIVAGMKDTQAKVEAGGRDLVLAAEGGAKTAAVIKSPSRKWRDEIGRNLGEGVALGLEDSADRIDEAARAAVPGPPSIGVSGGKQGGVVIQQIGPFHGMPEGGEQQVRRWVFDAIDDAAERIGALA